MGKYKEIGDLLTSNQMLDLKDSSYLRIGNDFSVEKTIRVIDISIRSAEKDRKRFEEKLETLETFKKLLKLKGENNE